MTLVSGLAASGGGKMCGVADEEMDRGWVGAGSVKSRGHWQLGHGICHWHFEVAKILCSPIRPARNHQCRN